MTRNINYIINYAEGKLSERNMQKFESTLQRNKDLKQDYLVYCRINEFMRGKYDLEEARNDIALQEIEPLVKESINEYYLNQNSFNESQKFIKEAVNERVSKKDLKEEIDQIKQDIEELDIHEISEGWVKEWAEKNQGQTAKDPRTEEIRDFINQSLKSEKNSSGLSIAHKGKDVWRKSYKLRVFALSAAVLISGIVLFRILIPSDNPSTLFTAFYKPMTAISPVTRGFSSNQALQYNQAIELYNKGDYQGAASMFNEIIQKDNSFAGAYFFQGITQLELGNYSQAISNLSIVATHSREFMKEAQWYLGLSYLKTGEKTKAIPYFEMLSGSEGFYRDQAKKLLRRLK